MWSLDQGPGAAGAWPLKMNSASSDSALAADVRQYLHSAWGSRSPNSFPGPHPVSIERKHLPLLHRNEYVVCEKTDGVRYLLVCLMHQGTKYAVFVNRKLDMFIAQLAMPPDTVLDGELIGNTFMVFDAVRVNGVDTRNMSYLDRLRHAEVATRGPRMRIKLQMKTVWPAKAAEEVWVQKKDAADGLVFTPVNEPIRTETHETMFKWKPFERITVDFKVDQGYMCIWGRGRLVRVQRTDHDDGVILECKYDKVWVPVKVRTDKDTPNSHRTMMNTLVNLKERIVSSEF